MLILLIARWVNILAYLIILLVFLEVVVSYFLGPYHPIRHSLERIVEPMLGPIRRIVPLVGGFDFSPLVLTILIVIISSILVNFLNALVR